MNTCSINSTASTVLPTTPSITNAKFTQLSNLLKTFGVESEAVHTIVRSGGGGFIPALDLIRDTTFIADSFNKYRKDPSTGHKASLIGRVTEVAYDISEMTPSFAKHFRILSPTSIEMISFYALMTRVVGQIILLPSCMDETVTSFGGISRLGTKKSHQIATLQDKTICVLTFLEAASSTVSNGALLIGGPNNSIHLSASATTNSVKVLFLFLPHIFIIGVVFGRILTAQKDAFVEAFTPAPKNTRPVKIKPSDLTPQQTQVILDLVQSRLSPDTPEKKVKVVINMSSESAIDNIKITPKSVKWKEHVSTIGNAAKKSGATPKKDNWRSAISPLAKQVHESARAEITGLERLETSVVTPTKPSSGESQVLTRRLFSSPTPAKFPISS